MNLSVIRYWLGGLTLWLMFSHLHASEAWLYPGSEVVRATGPVLENVQVIKSAPKRVSNLLRVEDEQWINGAHETWLLRLDRNQSMAQVYQYYQELISKQGNLAFTCESRACGTSSNWANKLLKQRELTGRDDNQFYLVGNLIDDEKQGWLSVYLVTNGRRQNYAYVQFVAADAQVMSAAASAGPQLLSWPGDDAAKLQDLVSVIASGGEGLVSIHTDASESLSLEQWRARANQQRDALAKRLDRALPSWREKVEILNAAPVSAKPAGINESLWLSISVLKRDAKQ